ncbi:hypothetical protein FPHYL_5166 [Fusarium phyllophilum]|uniref:Uncharacterized protein n=1 Tax=Fusarium phyllophilum TaxID=47803 RepID=A0A8H5JWT2_9HYPO|nr:hypothetical protein FPHYL_5166 [Fusarium phyllophilum]
MNYNNNAIGIEYITWLSSLATSPYNGHLPQHSDLYEEEVKRISTVIFAESHAVKKEDTQLNQAFPHATPSELVDSPASSQSNTPSKEKLSDPGDDSDVNDYQETLGDPTNATDSISRTQTEAWCGGALLLRVATNITDDLSGDSMPYDAEGDNKEEDLNLEGDGSEEDEASFKPGGRVSSGRPYAKIFDH